MRRSIRRSGSSALLALASACVLAFAVGCDDGERDVAGDVSARAERPEPYADEPDVGGETEAYGAEYGEPATGALTDAELQQYQQRVEAARQDVQRLEQQGDDTQALRQRLDEVEQSVQQARQAGAGDLERVERTLSNLERELSERTGGTTPGRG